MTHEDLPSSSFHYKQQSPFPAILQLATSKKNPNINVFHLHPKTCASLNPPHVLPSFQSRNLQENWDKLHKDPTKIDKKWYFHIFPHLIPSISQHFPPTPSCLSKVTLPGLALRKLMVSHPSYRRFISESFGINVDILYTDWLMTITICVNGNIWLIHCMISENDYLETWYYVQRCEFGSKILCI